jgi:hypothetical protein
MVSAKNIYGSKAYKQLKAYANGDKVLLKMLTEQFLHNVNMFQHKAFKNHFDVMSSFVWHKSLEGHTFWSDLHNSTCE